MLEEPVPSDYSAAICFKDVGFISVRLVDLRLKGFVFLVRFSASSVVNLLNSSRFAFFRSQIPVHPRSSAARFSSFRATVFPGCSSLN
jgi:hypothetical protein